ncbi:YoaK family protein [Vitiosangium sp. GDMCC 1.1324]|uniref:YoaK family protein n=1 Tax=Vitiosangium sp. (strain GDMCC 1.1324) TaxID=2138576 RepID=UPI000D3C47FE|nr:YoaK family protein [Vitiosangium sp. GDMCC 1.1324]PTL78784.1 hypothetical protein DAT35_37620 [Vitiosangium sp. GDMCC 1.1324]
MSEPAPAFRSKVVIALCLCLVAGFVDAVGYLTLDKLLLANMSGNTVRLAMRGVEGEWGPASVGLLAIVMFTGGLMLSGLVYELCVRLRAPPFRFTVLLEVALLGAFLVLGPGLQGPFFHAQVSLGALAMGMQNASLRRVGPFSVFTTHITGTLTKFGESVVSLVFWVLDTRGRMPRITWRGLFRLGLGEKSVQETFFMGGLWLMFLLGAAWGTLFQRRFGLPSLVAPVVLLLAVAVYDGFRPINPRGNA